MTWHMTPTAPGEVTYYATIDGIDYAVRHRHPWEVSMRVAGGEWQPSPVLTPDATCAMIEARRDFDALAKEGLR